MLRRFKGRGLVCILLSLIVATGLLAGMSNKVSADDEHTATVRTAEEFKTALGTKGINHIIIDQDIPVPCIEATNKNGTSFFTVTRSMTIEGSNPNITLIRTCADKDSNGRLQSIIGIQGNGEYDGIQVSMFNLTLDGGADFGATEGYARCSMSGNAAKVAGRSIVDVYKKATLNLENGLTIKNGYCTYSLTSLSDSAGSGTYGGGVRVDWETETGGGTVNVKAGSCIKNCVAGNYGGGIGAYSYARLNVYGGIIEDCSAYFGGAVGCTWRASHNSTVSGTFKMYGGTIRKCSAHMGGAISADGDADTCKNALYGGTIDNCTASCGSALALGGNNDGVPSLALAPHSDNGPLFITNCLAHDDDDATGYVGINLGGNPKVVTLESAMCSVVFKKFKDDTDNLAVLSVAKGMALGESFPADPTSQYTFIGWNTSPDGKGDRVDSKYAIKSNLTVYARWIVDPVFTDPESSITLTYGDLSKSVEIKDAVAPYGGEIRYEWILLQGADFGIVGNLAPGVYDKKVYQFPKLPVGGYSFFCYVSTYVEGFPEAIKMSDYVDLLVEPKALDISWSDTEFVYDGKAKIPKATISGVIEGDDVSVEVTGAKTEAGTYKATAKLVGEDADNYQIPESALTKEFTIKAKPVTLSLDKTSANVVCGGSLTLKATVKNSTSAVSWKSSDSKIATVDKNGKVTAKMAGEVTITATVADKTAKCKVTVLYKDVTNKDDFWYAPTNYLTAKGVVKGYANQTEFRPANDCTRAQMVTFLYRLQGEPKTKSNKCNFGDVKTTDYFYKPVIWAVEKGITTGVSKELFNPQGVCTRAQTVTFLWRMAGKPEPGKNAKTFDDVKTTDYFYKATLWASDMKILAGLPNGKFDPQGKCLRRQMVTFLYKYDKYVNGKG